MNIYFLLVPTAERNATAMDSEHGSEDVKRKRIKNFRDLMPADFEEERETERLTKDELKHMCY